MNYFGTDLREAGHFVWMISKSGEGLGDRSLNFKDIPFDPEELVNPENGYYLKRGAVRWYKFTGQNIVSIYGSCYTVCAICGSCSDDRIGSKSVFWVKEDITYEEMKERILSTKICKEIIEKMPFEVNWENIK